jgi:hypothetical protein
MAAVEGIGMDNGGPDARAEYEIAVLRSQREDLGRLVTRMSALRRDLPRGGTVYWRSAAQRRYTQRLVRLEDLLESAAAELQGALAATGTGLARRERPA